MIIVVLLSIYLSVVLFSMRFASLSDKYYIKYNELTNNPVNEYELFYINSCFELKREIWIPVVHIVLFIMTLWNYIKHFLLYHTEYYKKDNLQIKIFGYKINIKNPIIAIWTFWVSGRNLNS